MLLLFPRCRAGYAPTSRLSWLIDEATMCYTLGAAALSLIFSVMGYWRLDAGLMTLAAFVVVTPGVPLSLKELASPMPATSKSRRRIDLFIVVTLIIMATLSFMGALTPEVRHDPLFYHLQVPRLWLNFGRIVEVPENGHSYFPYGFEMLYAWSLSLGSDSAAKGLHWAAGVAAAGWCARLGAAVGVSRLYAAALFYFIHFVSYLSTTTYIDLATAMYALAAIAVYTERLGSAWSRGDSIVFGLLTGSALATKYTAWPLIGLPLGVAALASLYRRPGPLLLAGLATLVPILPWMIRNFVHVGNPVAPLMIGVFGPESAIRTGLAGSFDSFAGSNHSLAGFLLAPLAYARHLILQKYTLSLLGMAAGAALLLMDRARAERTSRDATTRRALAFLLLGMFLAEALFTRGHPDGRYGLAGMGIGAVLITALCARLSQTGKGRSLCYVAPLFCLAMFVSSLFDYFRFQHDLGERWVPLLTEAKRNSYLVARGIERPEHATIESLLDREHAGRVLGVGYPSHHRYWTWIQGIRNDPVDHAGGKNADPADIRESLLSLDFTHILAGANPGFDRAAWEAFLSSETDEVPGAPIPIRRVVK